MALPWFRIINTLLNLTDAARLFNQGSVAAGLPGRRDLVPARGGAGGGVEARLAGAVVSALKEAFNRDSQRLQFEREQREEDRRRAERLLKIELARQAGDREIGRLRWLAGAAAASWLGTLLFTLPATGGGMGPRAVFGVGWLLLLAALAVALVAQARIAAALARLDVTISDPHASEAAAAGTMATWLLVSGLAVIGLAVLLR